jgi:A/G-specific adenine glycosylase
VDGNVFRVLARYFGETTAIDSQKGKLYFTALANKLLYQRDPGSYNQAIMDFGATICKPQIAECQKCILRKDCLGYKKGLVNKLPVKEKKLQKRKRWFYYFVFLYNNAVLINKRKEKDIWQNLHEFYLYECERAINWTSDSIDSWLSEQLGVKVYTLLEISGQFRQQLTHQNLQSQFIQIELQMVPGSLRHFQATKLADLEKLAFPKLINDFLQEHPLKTRKEDLIKK